MQGKEADNVNDTQDTAQLEDLILSDASSGVYDSFFLVIPSCTEVIFSFCCLFVFFFFFNFYWSIVALQCCVMDS